MNPQLNRLARVLFLLVLFAYPSTTALAQAPVYALQWGSSGSGPGQFNSPIGIAVDASGNVYVVDGGNSRIQKFTANGAFLTQWGTYGSGPGQFDSPSGIAVDGSGHVYVTDYVNDRVTKFTSPTGVAVNGTGPVYVVDSNPGSVRAFTGAGVFLYQWGGYGSGNGQFISPFRAAVDASGRVFVSDNGNNRVQRFDPAPVAVEPATWGKIKTLY